MCCRMTIIVELLGVDDDIKEIEGELEESDDPRGCSEIENTQACRLFGLHLKTELLRDHVSQGVQAC